MLRAEMPEISDETWERIKRGLSAAAGGSPVYVPIYRKRDHLEKLALMSESADAQMISKALGISVRHARRLKRLR